MEDKEMKYHDKLNLLMEICAEHNLSIISIGHKYIRLQDNVERAFEDIYYEGWYYPSKLVYEIDKELKDSDFEDFILYVKSSEKEHRLYSDVPINETYNYNFNKMLVRSEIHRMNNNEISEEYINKYLIRDWKLNIKTIVVTNNYDMSKELIDSEYEKSKPYVVEYICSRHHLELGLESGEVITWVNMNDSSRGHKCHKAYIDENIDMKVLNCIIKPMFIFGCVKDGVKILQDELDERSK